MPDVNNAPEPIVRADGECVGYVRAIGDRFEALTLAGTPVGASDSRDAAADLVDRVAMARMAEPFWCRLPSPLAVGVTDLRDVAESEAWERVVVTEVSPTRATLRPYMLYPEDTGKVIVVDLPAADVLFDSEPTAG